MTMTLDRTSRAGPPDVAPLRDSVEPVLLHRRRGALLLVGVAATAVALAYAWRAVTGDGGLLAASVAAALAPLAIVHMAAWWDARIPLLVADETGIRLRRGRRWVGLRWDEVRAVRLAPARLPRRDAVLDVAMSVGGDRPLPLAMVDPADLRALPDALRRLAPATVDVHLVAREVTPPEVIEPEGATPDATAPEATAPGSTSPESSAPASTAPSGAHPAPAPERPPRRFAWWAATAHLRTTKPLDTVPSQDGPPSTGTAPETGAAPATGDVEAAAPRTGAHPLSAPRVARADVTIQGSTGSVSRPEPGMRTSDRGRAADEPPGAAAPAAMPVRGIEPRETVQPGAVPVIGPQIVTARQRLRLSVDELAERTRIRPHVIESIEIDDFSACGGDVYARGHLQVLARVLGIEPDGLLETYDERYRSSPVSARSVLEADLVSSGRSVTASSGPRWSVLVAVVVALALVWLAVRLLVPTVAGVDAADRGGAVQRQDGTRAAATAPAPEAAQRFAGMGTRTPPIRLRLAGLPGRAAGTSTVPTSVTVTARDGAVVFDGPIGTGEVERMQFAGTVTVEASDGGRVGVQVDGRRLGPLGTAGEPVSRNLGG